MRRFSFVRFGIAAALIASSLAACGSSDSRGRNVAELKGCAQGGPCQVGDAGPGGGFVVIGATEPGVDMWEVAPLNGYGTYLDAVGQLDDLNFGDVNGWTLPAANVNESIRNQIAGFACADGVDCASQFGDDTYWTSDMQDGKHVVVSFADGKTSLAEDDSTHFIRPVRMFQMNPPTVPDVKIDTTTIETTTTAESTTTTVEETTTTAAVTTTTEVPTTTTTEPEPSAGDGSTCSADGSCEIGDTGPGGGIVFYASVAPFSVPGAACSTNCHYLEVAPPEAQFQAPSSCGEQTAWAAVDVSGIGAGFANTNASAELCGNSFAASTAARAYRGGKRKDWYVPSYAEMVEMAKVADRVGGMRGYYWTSTQAAPTTTYWGATLAVGVAYVAGFGYQGKTSRDSEVVRVIRAFGGVVAEPATTTTTTTTEPPTTTTTEATTTTTEVAAATTTEAPATTLAPIPNQPCNKGGKCAPGDKGPGGGIVLRADAYDTDSVTLFEVAPATWFAGVDAASQMVSRMKLAGFGDWRMPTLSELAAMRAGRNQFTCAKAFPCMTGFANSKYWGISETLGNGVLDFSSPSGSASKAEANELHYVRPVRTIQVIKQVEVQLQQVDIQPPGDN